LQSAGYEDWEVCSEGEVLRRSTAARFVVELAQPPDFDASEYQSVILSQSSGLVSSPPQPLSLGEVGAFDTPLPNVFSQRVIPDSQELSERYSQFNLQISPGKSLAAITASHSVPSTILGSSKRYQFPSDTRLSQISLSVPQTDALQTALQHLESQQTISTGTATDPSAAEIPSHQPDSFSYVGNRQVETSQSDELRATNLDNSTPQFYSQPFFDLSLSLTESSHDDLDRIEESSPTKSKQTVDQSDTNVSGYESAVSEIVLESTTGQNSQQAAQIVPGFLSHRDEDIFTDTNDSQEPVEPPKVRAQEQSKKIQ
jgi:hypothetical protein